MTTSTSEKCPYCKSKIAKGAIKCAKCSEYIKRKMSVLLVLGIIVLPIIFVWVTLKKGYSAVARIVAFIWLVLTIALFYVVWEHLNTISYIASYNIAKHSASHITVKLVMPEQEKKYLDTVAEYSFLYAQADNELKKSKIAKERNEAVLKLQPSIEKASNWVGVVEIIGATAEGKAFIAIRLDERVIIKTWDSAESDATDKTLFAQGSAIYNTIAALNKGSHVRFSGKLLNYTNLSEEGRMEYPEVLARFSNIEPIQLNPPH